MNSGRFHRRTFHLLVQAAGRYVGRLDETHATLHELGNLTATQVGGQKDDRLGEIHLTVITQGQRGLVQHSQQQLPQRIAGLFDLVEEQETELQLVGMAGRQGFLRNQRMCLSMPQISRGRADQLGNLMRMLKFRAINLDHRTGFAKENLGSRFHNARLSRAGWPEKQKIPYRAAGRVQSGAKDLVEVHECVHTLFLSDNF